jgi:transcriptional regulator with XRE-family HTH domain
MSAEQLARRIGVSRATIVTLERSEAAGSDYAREPGEALAGTRLPPGLRARARDGRIASRPEARTRTQGRAQSARARDADRNELERLTGELLAGSARKLWR